MHLIENHPRIIERLTKLYERSTKAMDNDLGIPELAAAEMFL